jgi:hypothetical protein
MLPEPTYLKGIFMADLLEDEENSQKTSSSQANSEQDVKFNPPEDLEADIKKHLNVDFGSERSDQNE